MKAFGKKVKQLRKKRGLSQYQLSYDADIDRNTLMSIEKGKCNTSISNVASIAEALGVKSRDLIDL